MRHGLVILIILNVCLPYIRSYGQDEFHVQRITGQITFDGLPDEDALKNIIRHLHGRGEELV